MQAAGVTHHGDIDCIVAVSIIPIERLRWVTFGHVEADEFGAMNQLLAAAPTGPGRPRGARLHGVP
jgi:hypothetical protein